MSKRLKLLPLFGVIVGIAVTVALITQFLSGDGEGGSIDRVDRDQEARERRERPATGTAGSNNSLVRQRTQSGRLPNQTLDPRTGLPARTPDGDLSNADELSKRVLELLEAIADPKNVNKSWPMGLELKSILRKLGHRVDPAVIDRLFVMLQKMEPATSRRYAGMALGAIQGHEKIAERLLKMLHDHPKRSYTRMGVLDALGSIKVPSVLPKLVDSIGVGLDDEAEIVKVVGRIGGLEASEALYEKLADTLRPETRAAIEEHLKKTRIPSIIADAARQLPETTDKRKLASLVAILGNSRDPKHAKVLWEVLENETDARVQRNALGALAKIGGKESAEKLLALGEGGGPLAKSAYREIGRVSDPEALTVFTKRWDGLPANGRRSLMFAFRGQPRLSEEAVETAHKGLVDNDVSVRRAAAGALGRRGRDDSIDPLTRFIEKAASNNERLTGLKALERIGTVKAAEKGLQLLGSLPSGQERIQRRQFESILKRRGQR